MAITASQAMKQQQVKHKTKYNRAKGESFMLLPVFEPGDWLTTSQILIFCLFCSEKLCTTVSFDLRHGLKQSQMPLLLPRGRTGEEGRRTRTQHRKKKQCQ